MCQRADCVRCLLPFADPQTALAASHELSNMDAFQRGKHNLAVAINSLRADITHLAELQAHLGEGARDVQSIRLKQEVHHALTQVNADFHALKALHSKMEGSKRQQTKLGLTPVMMAERRDMLRLMGLEIMELTHAASTGSRSMHPESKEDLEMIERVAAHKQAQEDARIAKREARRNRAGRKARNTASAAAPTGNAHRGRPLAPDEFIAIDIPGLEVVELYDHAIADASPEVQAFQAQVESNRAIQDGLLVELLRALSELDELAKKANQQLTVQQIALNQVETAIDDNTAKLKGANRSLKGILKSSGGLSRWIPLMICCVVLLALLGYIFGIAK